MRTIDLTGKRFGLLTVLNKSENRGTSGELKWLCKCDCGNNLEVYGKSLRSGGTIACGESCTVKKLKENSHLIGKCFGRLTVIKLICKLGAKTKLQCRCACGNITEKLDACL